MLRICALLMISCMLFANTSEEADGFMDQAVKLMAEANEDSSKSVDAAVLLVQARDIYQSLEDWENVREANAYIFFCKKKMNIDDLDRYVERTNGSKEQAAKAIEVVDQVATASIAADKAETYFKDAQSFAAANEGEHFKIHIRYLEVAERFAETRPKVASQAMRLSSDAMALWAKSLQPQKPLPNTVFTRTHKKSVDLFGQERSASAPDEKTIKSIIKKLKKEHKEKYKSKKVNQFAKWLMTTAVESKQDKDLSYVLAKEAARVASDRKALNIAVLMEACSFIADTYAGPSAITLQRDFLQSVSSVPLVKATLLLLDQPDDQEANTLLGKSFCFTSESFKEGFTLLSAGVEGDWKRVAEMELLKPSSVEERLELADLWFSLGEDRDNKDYKIAIYREALYWYKKCLPDLSGLVKDRIEKKVTSLKKIVPIDLASLDFDNLTEEEWDLIPGKSIKCSLGNTRNQTKIKLKEGEEIRVVPHPTEEWGLNMGGGFSRTATYKGINMGGGMQQGAGRGRGGRQGAGGMGRVGQMEVYLEEDPAATPVSVGIISGPGEIFIGGSVPRMGPGSRAIGGIRVKFLPTGLVW